MSKTVLGAIGAGLAAIGLIRGRPGSRSDLAGAPRTYKQANIELMDFLASKGWSVERKLKVPHATSQDKRVRLYFKPQAVYYAVKAYQDPITNLGFKYAMSLTGGGDYRKLSPQEFTDTYGEFLRKERDKLERPRGW